MGSDEAKERCRELVERIKNGDSEAFSEIIQILKGRIFSVAYGFFRNREEALDITQEVFIRLWKMIRKIETKDIEAWVLKVTRNLCIDHYREKRRRELKEMNTNLRGMVGGREDEKELFQNLLEEALRRIPERQAFAFSLRFFSGMKISEMSEAMGISEGGAKSLLFKAVENIRKIMKEKENERV